MGDKNYYFFLVFKAHQHKAAGRKTRLDIQNYGCNGNLLCDHGVVGKKPHFLFAEPLKSVGTYNWLLLLFFFIFYTAGSIDPRG